MPHPQQPFSFTQLKRPGETRGRPRDPRISDEERAKRAPNVLQKTGQAIQKVSWWHEQVCDWMLLNPRADLAACARHFDVTQSWLSSVINSDAFKEFKALRMDQHRELVSRSVIDKVEGLAHLSLDILEERIEKEREEISLAFIKETATDALKALGYSGKAGGNGTTVQVNTFAGGITQSELAEARQRQLRVITQESQDSDENGGEDEAEADRKLISAP